MLIFLQILSQRKNNRLKQKKNCSVLKKGCKQGKSAARINIYPNKSLSTLVYQIHTWTLASDSIVEEHFVVENLEPNTSYVFLVRAKNYHGLSLPSQVTEPYATKRKFRDKIKDRF